jgi:predicted SAM-dependent methyltransferase
VGSGPNTLPGWLNTDLDPTDEVYRLDATMPWPLPAGAVSHVYGDDFVEHLTIDGVRSFLREAHRVMAPGARIRLVTPDVGATARLYLEGGPDADALMAYLPGNGYRIEHRVDLLRVTFAENGHHEGYLFDEQSLGAELVAAGFADVERRQPGESDDPVLRGIDSRTDPEARPVQLILEARA